ncbi:MAG: HEPN domain-containing protein [Nitrospirae bacterium]|nr:HEPN domain-containing protein [Nitrospirota bacterium]
MDTVKYMNNWLESAERDLKTADSLFLNAKYDWCLFIGHLVIEKALKALYMKKKNIAPPKTHNLIGLTENLEIHLTEEQIVLLSRISDFNIDARYPNEKDSFHNLCTKEFTREYLGKIKEIYRWLLLQIKQ